MNNGALVAGFDEVGWGAAAGPLVIGMVVMRAGVVDPLLRDSKAFKNGRAGSAHKQRQVAAQRVRELSVWHDTFSLMPQCLEPSPAFAKVSLFRTAMLECWARFPGCTLVMDGNEELYDFPVPYRALPKADQLVPACSAASIVAKVWRDQYMIDLAARYPHYAFEENKGYLSEYHRQALRRLGPIWAHRPRWIGKVLDP